MTAAHRKFHKWREALKLTRARLTQRALRRKDRANTLDSPVPNAMRAAAEFFRGTKYGRNACSNGQRHPRIVDGRSRGGKFGPSRHANGHGRCRNRAVYAIFEI
jgi:hypothetical protein